MEKELNLVVISLDSIKNLISSCNENNVNETLETAEKCTKTLLEMIQELRK